MTSPSFSLNFDSGEDPVAKYGFTFTRATSGTYINSAGLISTAPSGSLRYTYDPVTKLPLGILIEEQRTNLLTYSEQFNNVAWTKAGAATVSADATTSPDGSTTADLISANGSGDAHQTISVSPGVTYTMSFYVKSSGAGVMGYEIYDVTHGADIVAPTSYAGQINGSTWTRVSVSFTAPAGCVSIQAIPAVRISGSAAVYLWGAQLEAGAFPSSYIPTTSAAATRNADVLSLSSLNTQPWWNEAAGTFVSEHIFSEYSTTPVVFATNSSSNCGFSWSGGAINWWNGTSSLAVVGAPSIGSSVRLAFAYTSGTRAGVRDGGTVYSDANVPWPSVNTLSIGDVVSRGQSLNSTIKRLAYYNTRLPDSDLIVATTTGLGSGGGPARKRRRIYISRLLEDDAYLKKLINDLESESV